MRYLWVPFCLGTLAVVGVAGCSSSSHSTLTPRGFRHVVIRSDQSVILPRPGASYQLKADVQGPGGAVPGARLTWRSGDPAVVSVSGAGLAVAGAAGGSATITVSAPGAASAMAVMIVASPGPNTVLVPSTDVVSVTSGRVVLRSGGRNARLRVGSILVSGSRGGLLARVVGVLSKAKGAVTYATKLASLAQAFRSFSARVASPPTRAKLGFERGQSPLSIFQDQVHGPGVLVDPMAGKGLVTCKAPDGVLVTVSLTGPAFTSQVTFSLQAALDISDFTVRRFMIAAAVTARIDIKTGAVSFDASTGPSYTCTIPMPAGLTIPSPIFLGPVELDGSITPSAGFTVSAQATGTVTVTGPEASDTIIAADGVQYSNGTWTAIDDNASSKINVIPVGTAIRGMLNAAVDPFFRLDAGFAADLGGVYRLAAVKLAYLQPGGDLSLQLSTPTRKFAFGYSGPQWFAGFELKAGPELALSGPVFQSVQQFLSLLGIDLTVTTPWGQFDKKIPFASSPVPKVTAPATAAAGKPVRLTATVPQGFSGDTVIFEGFRDGAQAATELASAKVSGRTAAATWTPAAAADAGTYQVGALLFDNIFGSYNLPYPSDATTPQAYSTVIVTAARSTTTPDLYLHTPFTYGLYVFPHFPALIGLDNHDWISGLHWSLTGPASAHGTGTLHYDQCKPSCALGKFATYLVEVAPSSPQRCQVTLHFGRSQKALEYVFNKIEIIGVHDQPPAFLTGTQRLSPACGGGFT
jgi:hypothetical protein